MSAQTASIAFDILSLNGSPAPSFGPSLVKESGRGQNGRDPMGPHASSSPVDLPQIRSLASTLPLPARLPIMKR
jgi:hypothetical protein